LTDLDEAIRLYLAWRSIENEENRLELDGFQVRQVMNQIGNWNTAVKGRIGKMFCWLLLWADAFTALLHNHILHCHRRKSLNSLSSKRLHHTTRT